MKKIPTNLPVFILFVCHLLAVAILFYAAVEFTTPDSDRYLALADAIGNGNFGLETAAGFKHEFLRMPGYPAFLFLIKLFTGNAGIAVIVVQSMLYILSVWFVYKAVKWSFGDLESIVFLIFSLLYPVIAIDALYILPHFLTGFFISAGVFVLSNPKWKESTPMYFVSGLLFGFAAMQRPNIFPFAVLLVLVMLIFLKQTRQKTIVFACALILVMIPWYVRSYAVSGNISPSSNTVGLETMIYQGSLESRYAAETGSYFRRNHFPETYEEYKSPEIRRQLREIKQSVGLKETDSYFLILSDISDDKIPVAKQMLLTNARKNISDSPLRFLTIGSATILRMWIGKADAHPQTFFYPPGLFGFAIGGAAFVLALVGVVLMIFARKEPLSLLGLVSAGSFLFFTATLGFFHSEVRYANPVKLLYLTLSAFAVGQIWKYFWGNKSPGIEVNQDG